MQHFLQVIESRKLDMLARDEADKRQAVNQRKVSSSMLLLNWKHQKSDGRQRTETDFKPNNPNDILRQHTTTALGQ